MSERRKKGYWKRDERKKRIRENKVKVNEVLERGMNML